MYIPTVDYKYILLVPCFKKTGSDSVEWCEDRPADKESTAVRLRNMQSVQIAHSIRCRWPLAGLPSLFTASNYPFTYVYRYYRYIIFVFIRTIE